MQETILIIDFGGQYNELIARRVRESGVYSVIKPWDVSEDEIKKLAPKGIILTGGPNSVYAESAPVCSADLTKIGVPVLGICYGMQYLAHIFGGRVSPCKKSEYGKTALVTDGKSVLFDDLEKEQTVLMSHTDKVSLLPEGFSATSHTAQCEIASFENRAAGVYGVQFHPETESTENGAQILRSFVFGVCGASGDYSMQNYIDEQIACVRERVGSRRVILGLSGGVDSSVCASLLSEAVGEQLTCIYVDHGFMRLNETEEIRNTFENKKLNFVYVDAVGRFADKLRGVTEPEAKRKLIGAEFAHVFEDEAKKLSGDAFLAQGTIYPDIVESGKNKSAVIKSHHNVGGLPKELGFLGVVEPLAGLFKDEVRAVGRILGLPESIVSRQPFPGPGLAIRVIGELTAEKLDILRRADAIFREEMKKSRVKADQYFAVLTNTQSVGVMGDFRTYDYTLALRAVRTNDFMTCEFARLPYSLLARVSTRITNEVRGINRVVYDVTGKPPATIEWE